ncbi:MAG: hypothetical protein J7L91_05390 [Candidatus Korarchaeota archaeon]|nr:hypothetical protein [Candidatus Korarchaeota archaeon]
MEGALISLIDSINEESESVSGYNLAGEDRSRPFVVMDRDSFMDSLRFHLNDLALGVIGALSSG